MKIVDYIFLFLAFASLAMGLFLYLRPRQAIDLQIRFYALINWRMEPISWGKELRNTRLMGLSVVIVAIASLLYVGLYG